MTIFQQSSTGCQNYLGEIGIVSVRDTLSMERDLSQQRIRHFKILQSIYFAYDVGIISSYSNRTC